MLDRIIRFSLTYQVFVLSIAFLMAGYGLFALNQMPVDVFPDLNKPTVSLMTEDFQDWRLKKWKPWLLCHWKQC